MATRILDIPLEDAGQDRGGFTGYDRALFLLRAGERPVGQVTVPVRDGRVCGATVRRMIDRTTFDLAAAVIAEAGLFAPAPLPDLSITAAICTRERPDDLRRALDALTRMEVKGAGILVIDNCPATDATRAVAAAFPGVRYIMEPRKGLNNARNRALREAGTDIVAFIDDDAVADRFWLRAILRRFADDAVMAVTGLTMPYELENDAQEDFEALAGFSKRGFHGRSFQKPQTHPLATGQIGAGANMAIRTRAIAEIGAFDPALDAGTATQSGGDHEYFTRILRAGHRIVYEPAALNWHRHRRTRDELRAAVHGYGVGVYAAWTRSFLTEREWGVFRRAFGWFIHDQFPALLRSWLRPTPDHPRDIIWAELSGCLKGPGAYLRARRLARRSGHA